MRVFVITEAELAKSHGTGAQLLRLLPAIDLPFLHLYWMMRHGRRSSVPNSLLLDDDYILIPKIRGATRRLFRLLGFRWWIDDIVNVPRLSRLLASHPPPADVCYVVVGTEWAARRAASLLGVLKVPYVLHVMDLLDGPPVEGGAFAALIRGAASVLPLHDALREELVRARGRDDMVEGFVCGNIRSVAAMPPNGGRLRVVMAGRPYGGGCEYLAAEIERSPFLRSRCEFLHVGYHFPRSLQPYATNLGFLSDEEYNAELSACHFAFVPGPDVLDNFGLYSFPSRTVEYVIAGLPLLAHVARGTAAERLLSPIGEPGVTFVREPGDLERALQTVGGSASAWAAASTAITNFGRARMDVTVLGATLRSLLQSAAAGPASVKRRAEH